MKRTKIFADANLVIGKVDPNLYGSFVEHLGRAVYEGIYEPGHPTADENGFRGDVASLVKELNVPIVRYPGGNFLSGYNWRDGIGPRENRPTRLDLAWFSTETNEFGTDEFMKWCHLTGIEPMMGVNMGTGSIKDAAELVEYCNHAGGTTISNLRRANGAEEPYNVRYWCIGNEMDGAWQIGHLTAEEYGRKALEAAKVMRWANGELKEESGRNWAKSPLKLIVSGSSTHEMKTFPEWDRVVLEQTYKQVDYLSMHRYYMYDEDREDPLEDFLGSADDMNEYIGTLKATIEYVRAKVRSQKRVKISFDEWNIWSVTAPRREPLWKRAPHLLEDVYTFRDMLVFAGLMNTLLNNCDTVTIGCLAQLVNVIAPIMTKKGGEAIRQTIFYPFKLLSNAARGETVRTFSDSARFSNMYGYARFINEAVNHDREKRTVCVSLCNYGQSESEVELELRSFGTLKATEYVEMKDTDLDAANTFTTPDRIVPRRRDLPRVKDGSRVILRLPAMSWSFVKFTY